MSDNGSLPDPVELAARCAAVADDEPFTRARADAEELGARPLDALSADALRQVARLVGARGSVCLSPALGVAALAILAAGVDGAVVTCIDADPHHVDAAKAALQNSGHSPASARFITARPLDVVAKLTDGGYDLVVAEVTDDAVTAVVTHATRLLRTGGALVLIGTHAPLPPEAELPECAHTSMLPVGRGLTLVTY